MSSDENGEFSFLGLHAGEYTLEAYFDGYYLSHSKSINLTEKASQEVVFELAPMDVMSELMVVTGTRREAVLADVPVKTELICQAQVDTPLVRTLADVFEFAPGIRVESNCQNCNFTQIRINGLEGRFTQVLLDGNPMFSTLAGVYGLEQIPPEMIQQIEVVKGGGSALYGPSAVAGVVNIIQKMPEDSMGRFRINQGWEFGRPQSNFSGMFSHVSQTGRTGILGFGQVDRLAPIDRDEDGFTDKGYKKLESFGLSFFRNFMEDRGKLEADFHCIHENRRGGDQLDRPPDEAYVAEAIDSRRYGGKVKWQHVLSDATFYDMSFAYAYTDRDSYYGAYMDPNAYGFTNNPIFNVDGAFHHHVQNHGMTYGFSFNHEKLKDEAPAYDRFIDDVYHNIGAFAQDELEMTGWLTLVGGVRLDKANVLKGVIFSPRWSAMVRFNDDWKMRVAVSKGFNAPRVFDEDLHITQVGGEGAVIFNAPNLKEERSLSASLNLEGRWQRGDLAQTFSLTGFYTRLDNIYVLEQIDDPDDLLFQRINADKGKVYGFEVTSNIRFNRHWFVRGGLTVERGLYDEPEPDFNQREFFRTPRAYGYLTVDYKNPRLFNLMAGLQYTGQMKVPHYAGYIEEDRLDVSPSFYVVDVMGSKDFFLTESERTILRFSAGVKNIFDEFQDDFDRGPDRDAGYIYGPRYMRTVFATLEFILK